MTTSAPVSHLQESQKLTADAIVDLYTITLKNDPVIFRFRDGPTVTWQGHMFEGMACSLTGDTRTAEGEESRPTLRIMNPLGIFNEAALNHQIDLAVVKRQRILRQHLESNANIYEQRLWFVGRVQELISGQLVSLQLRNMSEGPNFQIPVRTYNPSDGFPTVSL